MCEMSGLKSTDFGTNDRLHLIIALLKGNLIAE